MKPEITVYASSLHRWSPCPARAQYDIDNPRERMETTHVGTVIGRMVHHNLTGEPAEFAKELIQYDTRTRTWSELESHVEILTDKVRDMIGYIGMELQPFESTWRATLKIMDTTVGLSARPDFIGFDGERSAIFDIKTSVSTPKVSYLQMCAYALMARIQDIEIDSVQILFVKRDGILFPTGTRIFDNLPRMRSDAIAALKARVGVYLNGAYRNPTNETCGTCRDVNCFANQQYRGKSND